MHTKGYSETLLARKFYKKLQNNIKNKTVIFFALRNNISKAKLVT